MYGTGNPDLKLVVPTVLTPFTLGLRAAANPALAAAQ